MPGIQNFVFEWTGEQATGLMQAAINQDGSFFTPEAQKQILALTLLASGGFAAGSVPQRIALKRRFNRANQLLDDIPNAEYTEAVRSISENYTEADEVLEALDDLSGNFQISMEDYIKARAFVGNTIAYNQMNTARAIKLEQNIAQSVGNDGNVTLTQYQGVNYAVRNASDLGQSGKVIYLIPSDGGAVKPVMSDNLAAWETKTPDQVKDEQLVAQDETDEISAQEITEQEQAAKRGLIPGNTVETPNGKRELVSLDGEGKATVRDTNGEEEAVNLTEIEPYRTKQEQVAEKEASETQAEADAAISEGIEAGAEVVTDEPLVEGSDVRVVDFSNGQSKIITPEGETIVNTKEERDATVNELVQSELGAAQEVNIDELAPEEAFRITYADDPEIAIEVFRDQVGSLQGQAAQLRDQAKASNVASEKVALLKQAKEIEAQVAPLNQILEDPQAFIDQAPEVKEEVAAPVEEAPAVEEVTAEQQTFDQADALYNEYLQEEQNAPYNQLEPWQQELLGSKITIDSFNRFGDPNAITNDIKRFWTIPTARAGASNTIDVVAEELTQQTGQNITPEMIVDFITSNPTNTVRKTTNRQNEIRQEYKNVSGQTIDKHNDLRNKLGLEPAPELPVAEDVVDDPLEVADKPEGDVPFRVEEGVAITDKANKDVKHRKNALKALNELQAKFGIPIQIINSTELTDEAKRKAKQIGAPTGFYQDGTVYIVSDKMTSVGLAKKTYLHEALVHKGLDMMFDRGSVTLLGNKYDTKADLLDFIFSRLDDNTIKNRAEIYAAGVALDQLTDNQKREIAEEALATLSETESPRVQVILDKIYNYIRSLFGFTKTQLTKADLRTMLNEHAKQLRGVRTDVTAQREKSKKDQVKFRTEEGQNFEQWKGDNELVEDYRISDIKTGQPVVARAYHGTTHPFYEFKGGELGNIEGHLGATNYFTSEYGDAQQNYGAEGADLTGRIEQRAEQLEYDLEQYIDVDGVSHDLISEEYNISEEDIKDFDNAQDIASAIAENELKGQEEQVLDLYLKINNPLVLGADPVYVEAFDESYIDDYMDEAYEAIAEENEISEDEAKTDEWESEARDKARELAEEAYEEPENKLADAFNRALEQNGIYGRDLNEFAEIYDPEVDLNQLEKDIRNSEEFSYLENDEGKIVNSQVLSDFFEELGYDAVILTDVADRFPGMDLHEGVSHIHIPDQYNNQIKLADGSNVDFGETSDIRFKAEEDYKGEHSAPYKNDADMPMNNLIDIYGDDIYTNNAVDYFSTGEPYDQESIRVIQSMRNKPNAKVKVYRAVPDNTKDIKKQRDEMIHIINYHRRFNFFPMKNDIVYELEEQYPFKEYGHQKQTDKILEHLDKKTDELDEQIKKGKLKLNSGDWVTTARQYAVDHGKRSLNNRYKILTKTVRADELFTDGNSIHEWGYDSKADQKKRDADETKFRVAESPKELEDFVKDSQVKETVYHGTQSDFTEFDEDMIGAATNVSGVTGKGFYFSKDKDIAGEYGTGGRVMNVKLDIRNPYIVNSAADFDITKTLENTTVGNVSELNIPFDEAYRNDLIANGYDGVINNRDNEIVVFKPEQILIEKTDDVKFRVEEQRDQVNQDPSEAQKEAGNYKMGHVKIDGMDITIENPLGSIRSGVDRGGQRWSSIMPADYGYIKGTVGKDKDHIDIFLGDNVESNRVFIVDQVDTETGKFDEHKIMIGYNSLTEARNAYNEAYDEGWQGLGNITSTTKEGLKNWLKEGDTKKPYRKVDEDIRFRVESDDPETQKLLDQLAELQKMSKSCHTSY